MCISWAPEIIYGYNTPVSIDSHGARDYGSGKTFAEERNMIYFVVIVMNAYAEGGVDTAPNIICVL